MSKTKKIVTAIVVVVALGGLAYLSGTSQFFQANVKLLDGLFGRSTPAVEPHNWYTYHNRVVSPVPSMIPSPVPSVVPSSVTTPGGTSTVPSVIVTPVPSAVPSPVPAPKDRLPDFDITSLPALTERVLESVASQDLRENYDLYMQKAWEDYKNNPEKYSLSEREKQSLIELYMNKYPEKFIFRPAR